MNLTDRDRKTLWTKAGNLCSYNTDSEKCRAELIRLDNGKYVIVGEECHIVGEKPKAARYIEDYPDRETYLNAILMCSVHHKVIDDNPAQYSTDDLHAMKGRHEKYIQQALSDKTLEPLIIKDSEFITIVNNAQRAIGMEVNRPAILSNVRSELHVGGKVEEAIGFSTNQGLTGTLVFCSCGKPFSVAFTGSPPAYVVCPHCGSKHEMHH